MTKATTVIRTKTGKDHNGAVTTRGHEVVRSAECPEHKKRTSKFIGVNYEGWIFECPGKSSPHKFVAEPAE